ncbi:ABC transporter ATP-binding protein [Eubacterium barkeri]|uniref:Putative ABC transport system ATP-binding protein n=1 Tax=Eubacterium barkeri TaxID=1528 RepID=A0A1H3AD41_EUBBA|nr:ABC transporter ATP-binding protein [Eubacterium barkeri]SDX27632.1 putative ABC transport system ATP-binding protein [Eubacterium barkeri]
MIEMEGVGFRGIVEYPLIQIPKGRATFILGESGSGKSTLLRLINGTARPTKGVIRLDGADIAQMDGVALRRRVLLVDQTPYLFGGSIAENVAAYYNYRGLQPPSPETMARYLALCQAPYTLDRDTGPLSGGERHRVFLAIFLSFEPEILMLDEPTAALDEGTAMALMDAITTHLRERGTTLLVVSHNRKVAEAYADGCITLEKKLGGHHGK